MSLFLLLGQFNFPFGRVDHSNLKDKSNLFNAKQYISLAYLSFLTEQKFEFLLNLLSFFLSLVWEQNQPGVCPEVEHWKYRKTYNCMSCAMIASSTE